MTAENTSGNLDRKVILTFPFDPWIPIANENVLLPPPGDNLTSVNYGPASLEGTYPYTNTPDHWQDTVHAYIMEKNVVGGVYAGTASANHFGGHAKSRDPRTVGEMTIANEFELDVNQLTHTFQSLTAVAPLPGMPNTDNNREQRQTVQLNSFAIDLGMMREIISVQGILIDRKENPSSSSGHHIRRQHLLDMVRAQYAFLREFDVKDTDAWLNINKFPALTIGPIYDRTTDADGDTKYTGDQPSDDIRGTEHSGPDRAGPNDPKYAFRSITPAGVAQNLDVSRRESSRGAISVARSWDFKPTYKGRNRYRGLIRRANVRNEGGRPDIWTFNFEFVVIKNEMQQRIV
jgi:hypothetical protein